MTISNHTERAILVVEDDAGLNAMLVRVLISWGFVVRHATSLEKAVRAVFSWGPFEAVICDYHLPDGSGLVFKNWLREQVIVIPFVLISGRLDEAPIKSSRRFEFLRKPFALAELRVVLDRLLPDGVPDEAEAVGAAGGSGKLAVLSAPTHR
ncbi:MAG TPA: response regulator [Chthoniobacteraceae bacterium]|nr:response regulator [Chthoniobacteraceae bacterium]